jgi:hypothetical protein
VLHSNKYNSTLIALLGYGRFFVGFVEIFSGIPEDKTRISQSENIYYIITSSKFLKHWKIEPIRNFSTMKIIATSIIFKQKELKMADGAKIL